MWMCVSTQKLIWHHILNIIRCIALQTTMIVTTNVKKHTNSGTGSDVQTRMFFLRYKVKKWVFITVLQTVFTVMVGTHTVVCSISSVLKSDMCDRNSCQFSVLVIWKPFLDLRIRIRSALGIWRVHLLVYCTHAQDQLLVLIISSLFAALQFCVLLK